MGAGQAAVEPGVYDDGGSLTELEVGRDVDGGVGRSVGRGDENVEQIVLLRLGSYPWALF